MTTNIDYSTYTYEELLQARDTIDAEAYPERLQQIDNLLEQYQKTESAKQNPAVARQSLAKFHGNAKEYFSIWIVNLLLTIVTLGIYSPWAKVRNNRYIYGNTEVDGHRFSYLADPLQILKGRVIALVTFAVYYFIATSSPMAGLFLILFFLFVSPFVICLSLRFRMRVTGYRNVRFNFHGRYGRAFVVFTVYPILSLFTLYLALPWAMARMDEFIVKNTTYGDKKFIATFAGGEYFIASIVSVLLAIPFFVIMSFAGVFSVDPEATAATSSYVTTIIAMFCYVAIYTLTNSYYRAKVRNHIYNNAELTGMAKFESNIEFTQFAVLNFTNLLALIFTLGLAMPWTQTRTLNFLCNNTNVLVLEGADQAVLDSSSDGNAIGDEVADAFDFEIALG